MKDKIKINYNSGTGWQSFVISYEKGTWDLQANDIIRLILPKRLSDEVHISVGSTTLNFSYIDRQVTDKDYSWLLLWKIICQELPEYVLYNEDRKKAIGILEDFFRRIEKVVQSDTVTESPAGKEIVIKTQDLE